MGWNDINSSEGPIVTNKVSLKALTKVFLTNQRYQNIYSILSGLVPFILLTSSFLIWFSYKDYSFQNYTVKNSNWADDDKISAYSSNIVEDFNPDFDYDYLENVINETRKKINSIIPSAISDNYTGALSVQLFYDEWQNYKSYEFITLDNRANEILSQCLISGRLPVHSNEILYYHKDNPIDAYSINESISLKSSANFLGEEQNFTIVGILAGVDDSLYNVGYSFDLLSWQNYLVDHIRITFYGTFFTTPNLFFEALNNYTKINCNIVTLIDFNYETTEIDVRQLSNYLNKLQSLLERYNYFQFTNYGTTFNLGSDLNTILTNFELYWLRETLTIMVLSIPVLFLLVFSISEVFRIGKPELQNTISLMKLQGVDNNTLLKVILLENLIISLVCLIGGVFFGTLIGYLVTLSFQDASEILYFLSGLKQINFIVISSAFFLIILVSSFLFKNYLIKTSTVIRSEKLLTKRKGFLDFFKTKEMLFLIPGVFALAIGIFIQIFLVNFSENLTELAPYFSLLEIISWISIYFGASFFAVSFFFIISRLIILFWSFFGKKLWDHKKSFFGLTFKSFVANPNYYFNIIFAMLIVGFGLIPGIIINTSINQHIDLETDLKIGCSDLVVFNWTQEEIDKEKIETIDGINLTTEISIIHYQRRIISERNKYETYSVKILALKNCSAFSQIVDFTKLGKVDYSKEDIKALKTNMTYLENKRYAKKTEYDIGEIFFNLGFSQSSYEITMTYINHFDYFPGLPLNEGNIFRQNYITYSLVTSNNTISTIEKNFAGDTCITRKWLLLVKLNSDANSTKIKREIHEKIGLSAISKSDIIEKNKYQFSINYLLMCTLITSIITALVCFLTARNIYRQKILIIEVEYRIGATRTQIWGIVTLEFISAIILSIILSTIAGTLLVRFLGFAILNVQQDYKHFIPWIPWWIVVSMILLCLIICLGGWSANIIPQIKKYRPNKQE